MSEILDFMSAIDVVWPLQCTRTFQRLMERAMSDLNLRDCHIYLDDIIIFSDTFESHLSRLEAVFRDFMSTT